VAWIAGMVAVLLLAGCNKQAQAPSNGTTPGAGTGAHSTAPCVIPQGNGGDHDADNNGGPSDGDGCDR